MHLPRLFIDADDVNDGIGTGSVEASGQLPGLALLWPVALAFDEVILHQPANPNSINRGNHSGFKINGAHRLNAIQWQ
jgi:hypothetical protein